MSPYDTVFLQLRRTTPLTDTNLFVDETFSRSSITSSVYDELMFKRKELGSDLLLFKDREEAFSLLGKCAMCGK